MVALSHGKFYATGQLERPGQIQVDPTSTLGIKSSLKGTAPYEKTVFLLSMASSSRSCELQARWFEPVYYQFKFCCTGVELLGKKRPTKTNDPWLLHPSDHGGLLTVLYYIITISLNVSL